MDRVLLLYINIFVKANTNRIKTKEVYRETVQGTYYTYNLIYTSLK